MLQLAPTAPTCSCSTSLSGNITLTMEAQQLCYLVLNSSSPPLLLSSSKLGEDQQKESMAACILISPFLWGVVGIWSVLEAIRWLQLVTAAPAVTSTLLLPCALQETHSQWLSFGLFKTLWLVLICSTIEFTATLSHSWWLSLGLLLVWIKKHAETQSLMMAELWSRLRHWWWVSFGYNDASGAKPWKNPLETIRALIATGPFSLQQVC